MQKSEHFLCLPKGAVLWPTAMLGWTRVSAKIRGPVVAFRIGIALNGLKLANSSECVFCFIFRPSSGANAQGELDSFVGPGLRLMHGCNKGKSCELRALTGIPGQL